MENVTSTNETTLNAKEDVTMDKIENLANLVHAESIKHKLSSTLNELDSKNTELMGALKGMDSDKEFIEKRLREYSVDELESYLKIDKNVESFFVNPETGVAAEFNTVFDSKQREIEFKRGFLAYLKSTQEAYDKIDEQFDELDKYTEEMNANIKEVCDTLSDNVLTYISYMEDKADKIEDEKIKKKLLTTLKYIKSGYDLSIYSEVIDKYPSVAEKCVNELVKESFIQKIGSRYLNKLQSRNVKISLIDYVSDNTNGKLSFEEKVLIKDDQYVIPDLFVFSLIRFFSMADWSDNNIMKAHASIMLVLKKLVLNNFEEDVKNKVIEAITAYLAKFPVK